jgi:glycosyltransferase involved in cell wall biosynthesis
MRINFISPTPGMGGGTRVIAIYADALMKMGHDVCVVSVPPRIYPIAQKFKSWLRGNGWPADRARRGSHLDAIDVDHRILDRWRPITDGDVPDGDVVIATWWETAEWVAALNRSKGAKVYFIQHHEIFDYLPVTRVHATYRLPFHKIVIARWLERVMREQYDDHNVDVVPNSVDRTQFFAPDRGKQHTPAVGFLYATPHFKGLDLTLAVLRKVREKIPNLRIISFGSETPIRSLALPEGAEYLYRPLQERIRNLYASCDVWLTASRSEGFNLPALEAMACRTPVVSTRTGWPEEAIRSEWNGVLVDVDDLRGLAEGVEWILSQSNMDWRELSQNAFATSSLGSWQESTRLFELALEHACGRRARGETQVESMSAR